jgi:inorganic triphosphatase YgiF
MSGTLEVELKFGAAPEALQILASTHRLGPARLGAVSNVDELDRYLDTPDLRLAALGWACRLRGRHGRTRVSLKGPAEGGTEGAMHRRPELEGPATDDLDPGAWPASAARDSVMAMSGGAALHERFRLEQVRRERTVAIDGQLVGILSLDLVRVERDGVRRGQFDVVELELTDDAVRRGLDVMPLRQALETMPGLVPEPRTKLEHALEWLDRAES